MAFESKEVRVSAYHLALFLKMDARLYEVQQLQPGWYEGKSGLKSSGDSRLNVLLHGRDAVSVPFSRETGYGWFTEDPENEEWFISSSGHWSDAQWFEVSTSALVKYIQKKLGKFVWIHMDPYQRLDLSRLKAYHPQGKRWRTIGRLKKAA